MPVSEIEIVFIHLGNKIPKYLELNLARTKEMFPMIQVVLVSDYELNSKIADSIGVKFWQYTRESSIELVLEELGHDLNFRNGFWKFSIERLIALCDYRKTLDETKVATHIESDVLLMPNFPFSVFDELNMSGWLRFNADHDVAAIITLASNDFADKLRNAVIQKIKENPKLTDMTVLSKISQKFPNDFLILPSLENPESEMVNRYSKADHALDLQKMSQNFTKFNGIFDAAPIGMWMIGQDPRNHRGILRRYIDMNESYIHPGRTKYYLRDSSITNSQGVSIFNLHIHSKEEKYFGRNWEKHLTIAVHQSRSFSRKNRLLIKVSLGIIVRKLVRDVKSVFPIKVPIR